MAEMPWDRYPDTVPDYSDVLRAVTKHLTALRLIMEPSSSLDRWRWTWNVDPGLLHVVGGFEIHRTYGITRTVLKDWILSCWTEEEYFKLSTHVLPDPAKLTAWFRVAGLLPLRYYKFQEGTPPHQRIHTEAM